MKRILSTVLLVVLVGCGTPNQVAYKTTAVTVATVNAFEDAYGKVYRNGLVDAATQTKVHTAIDSYNAALAVEKAVVNSAGGDPTAAAAAVTAAEQAVIAAITPLLSPDQTKALLLIQ